LSYKVAHISDTHIRLLKFHKEYRIVFEQIYSLLKKGKVDYIVHCGDLFHNKTNLSPEAVKLSSEFLKGLADIAPTMVIAGNHDGNLKNIKICSILKDLANFTLMTICVLTFYLFLMKITGLNQLAQKK
jgi:DNA repair exonuclease SbcCD nuclease subunit